MRTGARALGSGVTTVCAQMRLSRINLEFSIFD